MNTEITITEGQGTMNGEVRYRYAGIISDHNLGALDPFDAAMLFDSIHEARWTLWLIRHRNEATIRDAGRTEDRDILQVEQRYSSLFPCTTDDVTLDLWPIERIEDGNEYVGDEPAKRYLVSDYPSKRLEIGPRGGVRVENF